MDRNVNKDGWVNLEDYNPPKSRECMLSTSDNPFNPYEQWDSWYKWDILHGYDSCGYLARIAQTYDTMTPYEIARENERAIDEIIKFNLTGNYIKVFPPKK
jgi:hypothetical protein